MHWGGSKRLVMLLIANSMMLGGCQTTMTRTSETDLISREIVCRMFPERSYSRNDTIETRRHIVGDNAAKRELCEAGNV